MKRVRGRTLVLVNWKGVFYERYTLDENVTALEGDNGAGKTTVMIGAYVVLLPDMTRLRFTNVGESDATGGDKGVWGRLGDPNRPSYAVMVFDVGGEHVVAGVHLERKGEPSVELTPFLISELPADVRLQDALLLRSGDEDLVPELGDLRENVARLGGRVQVCRTAKEYFSALFERGITPLRLVADEERTRFNDMLRTSMTGGISRALTSEFRSFLLKEESGLADTLVRMRSNLDACRRTRTEVMEAQELEREISGVYEAGHAMFAAALLATRERAEELRRRVEEARQKRDNALRERDAVARELEEQTEERTRVDERLRKAKEEHEAARKQQERIAAANGIAKRVARFDEDLRGIGGELETAALAMKRANEIKVLRADERTRAEETYRRAAEGLADLQRGLEELHRRADAHRTVMRRLAEARGALERPELAAEEVDGYNEATKATIAAIDGKRNELDAAIGSAEAHRTDHGEAMQALTVILDKEVDPRDAHVEARTALRTLSDLDGVAARAEALNEELGRARDSLARQQVVRAKAEEVSQPEEPLTSLREVHDALRKADADIRAAEEQARHEESRTEDLRRTQEAVKAREKALQIRSARWRELDTVASRLEATLGAGLRTAEELEAARQVLDDERDEMQRRIEGLEGARAEAKERAQNLEETGGVFHVDLLTARDLVDGELLASHFDDVDPAEAGQVQARLGPLSEAIVVDDAREAAATLAGRERALDTIWLVEEGGLHDIAAPNGTGQIDIGPTDIVVEQHGVVRTTRVPSAPTLGKKARERLIADLQARTEKLGREIDVQGSQLGEIASRRRDTALLTREVATLQLGDPAHELRQVAADLMELEGRIEGHVLAADEARRRVARLSQRSEKLRDLLAGAFLLDEPDLAAKVNDLKDALRSAVRARSEIARVSVARPVLAHRIDVLRRPPLSEPDIGAMRGELSDLRNRRERLFLGLDALGYIATNREALEWSDAEGSLSAKQELVPALKAQCEKADAEQRSAVEAAQGAEAKWEQARETWRGIDDRRSAFEERRQQAQGELEASGIDDPSDAAVERARAASDRLRDIVDELDQLERKLGQAIAQLNERLEGRETNLRETEEQLSTVEKEWKPAEDLWERLRARAQANGLLTPAITARLLNVGVGSINLRSEARSWGKALDERLSSAQGGQEILERIRSWLSGQEQTTGDDYLQAWEVVRDWLRRRVPAQVAEVDDPLEALERLRHHLKALGDRLDDQERKLRGASEDVARGIDVHVRAAQRQVRLLNRELEGVRFGTIRSMQIRLSRDDRMEGVLRALREGSAQELLFAPTMPVEDALEALFTRYGGRGLTVGQKLLDYREYVDIAVEIQRQASPQWERVNPSRLSTGEAIGVGTALMMVVLTAWERAANLFRAKRSLGTLRLLFLDEANRLSQDNLDVLFELCTALDLQLLIAAPEVARAPGCTTYRLVRRETPDGGEEVVVSGRRAVVEA
jgi:chromosome partition protein MukB